MEDECPSFLNSEFILPLVILHVLYIFFKEELFNLNLAESISVKLSDLVFQEKYYSKLNHNCFVFGFF